MRIECTWNAALGDKLCAMPLIVLQTNPIDLRVAEVISSPPKQNMSHELANLFSPLKKLFPGRSFVSPQSILLFAKPLAGASAQWLPHHFLARTTGHGWLNGSFESDVESIEDEAVYSLFAILTWCSFLVDRKPLISLSLRRCRRIYSRYI